MQRDAGMHHNVGKSTVEKQTLVNCGPSCRLMFQEFRRETTISNQACMLKGPSINDVTHRGGGGGCQKFVTICDERGSEKCDVTSAKKFIF